MDFLISLYDSYAAPVRAKNMDNPRLSPALASIETLPENILVVVAGIDIVVHEQMTLVERVQKETSQDPQHQHGRIEVVYIDKAFHGILSGEHAY
jgi:acetyl esterase/lipase